MREGSLEPPTRLPIDWQDPSYYDENQLDAELRRQFDVCQGCRLCFNLCDSFPRLFDLIDATDSGELTDVKSADFEPVVEACTLCDMCFMTKCPYVPPHEFNIDFPHLMLRYRAVQHQKGQIGWAQTQLSQTDRNGALAVPISGVANWVSDTANTLTRPLMEKVLGVDQKAALPKFQSKTFVKSAQETPLEVNKDAPAYGRKVVLYATCFVNYNNASIGDATRRVLAHNGVETQVVYPQCCGMPQLEQGDLGKVAQKAEAVALELKPWIDEGYDVVALMPSCALMLKFEWPLICPDNGDVKRLSQATFDVSEYVVDLSKKEGLTPGLTDLDGNVSLHIACHARAQNMGQKAAQMLRLIPEAQVHVVERCSGHGGSWGVMKENFDVALKVGRPVARQMVEKGSAFVVSECPLAATHIAQGMQVLTPDAPLTQTSHPIEILAKAYGLV
jgi:glycerol-3-phosphate dehydrogenase subunit C